jgi:hypothetical protein
MEALKLEQGSVEWLKARLGVITASYAHDLVPTITETEAVLSKKDGKVLHPVKRTVKFRQARQTYLNQLIAEVCTGKGEELNAKALSWGKENEAAARAAYQFESGEKVLDAGFIYGFDKRVGCSPDGLIAGRNKGLELKCPYSSDTHIAFLTQGIIKDEYLTQCQWSMWVAGFDSWAFASFDPRMKKHMIGIKLIERDEKIMELFNEIVPVFIAEMDAVLEKLEIPYGNQWT